jgi:aliphatic nitrilase
MLMSSPPDAIVAHTPTAAETLDSLTQGASLFLDPTGAQIGDQVQGEEGIAYGDLDLNACVEPKQFHDVVGGYQRFDIFDLRVNRERQGPQNAFKGERKVDPDSRADLQEGDDGNAWPYALKGRQIN